MARLTVNLSLVGVNEERSLPHTSLEKFIRATNLRVAFIHAAYIISRASPSFALEGLARETTAYMRIVVTRRGFPSHIN